MQEGGAGCGGIHGVAGEFAAHRGLSGGQGDDFGVGSGGYSCGIDGGVGRFARGGLFGGHLEFGVGGGGASRENDIVDAAAFGTVDGHLVVL